MPTEASLWVVVVYNDDHTPMSFVTQVLMNVFNKSLADASTIMMYIHENDSVSLGPYTKDIARTKMAKATSMADAKCFPLYVEVHKQ